MEDELLAREDDQAPGRGSGGVPGDVPRDVPGDVPGGSGRDRAAEDLALPLAAVAGLLRSERLPEDVVTAFVHEAARWVPGAEVASITAVQPGKQVTTAAASSPLAVEYDRMQYETGEGPCLTALSGEQVVLVDDLHTADDRWPGFSTLAAQAELRSALALQLWAVGEEVGALNLFSRLPDAFDDSSEQVALLFATHASLLLGSILRTGQLEQAVATRDVIGMAKGLVMARHGVDEDTAFSVLVRYSRDTNTKLREVAAAVVASRGSLPS